MIEWIKPGQKVVALYPREAWGHDPDWAAHVKNFPEKDQVYTIRDIDASMSRIGLTFQEFSNPVRRWPNGQVGEAHFEHKAFRPVEERKTDISIFTKMLGPVTPARVDA